MTIVTAAGTAGDVLPQIRDVGRPVAAGEFGVVAHVEADTGQALLTLVSERIQTIVEVNRTRTCIVLA